MLFISWCLENESPTLLHQELIEEYEKKHGGDDKEAGGSKRKGAGDGSEPKSKSAKKPDTRQD